LIQEVTMRVLRWDKLPEKPMDSATPIPGWSGGPVSGTRQTIIGDGDSENYRCSAVHFGKGATTGWHTHTAIKSWWSRPVPVSLPQIARSRKIAADDIVHIKAGERHWHGAKEDTTMSHITVTAAGSQSIHPSVR
jgi:quercetin dioxygenase-like cupin family protein